MIRPYLKKIASRADYQGWTVSSMKVSRFGTSGEFRISAPGIVFNNPGIIDLFSYKIYGDTS